MSREHQPEREPEAAVNAMVASRVERVPGALAMGQWVASLLIYPSSFPFRPHDL